VFKVTLVSHVIHAHLIVAVFLDEFFLEQRFPAIEAFGLPVKRRSV
jgi:hypothetical protein